MNELAFPHNTDLEKVILGACLIETTALPLVADKLRPEMFYDERHREVFTALMAMYHTGRAVDAITVREELAARGKLDFVGGAFALLQLTETVISSAHLEEHALILLQKYVRGETILGLHRLAARAADESIDIADTLGDLHQLLDHLENQSGTTDHLRDMDRLMLDALTQMDARIANNRNGVTGVTTGLPVLDRLTAGWQGGDLIVISARPSVGKTAFALHLTLAAARAGTPVAVYSLEMQGERLADRLLCSQADHLDAGHLRTGMMDPAEQQQALEAARELACLPIQVDDSPVMGMDHIRSSARMLKSKGKCGCVIIDYLQLCDIKSDKMNRNREQEVAEASRKGKLLAKELDIPVILLCQLNRDCETRSGHRPELSDLRESGAIEQDADMVLLLYRPALYGLTTERKSKYPSEGLGVAIVAKHRNGETGDIYFGHNPELTKIGEYVPPMEWMMRNAR